jgi:hypothetical protein
MNTILGQRSWRLASDSVEAFVTETGGHVGPVTFDRKKRKIQPYSVAPWALDKISPKEPAIIRVLRGDFFCMPFGSNATPYKGERHPLHGEVANARWTLKGIDPVPGGGSSLRAKLKTKVRPGVVEKRIEVRDGQNVFYSRHTVSGMKGVMNFGHHAMIEFPDHAGSGLVATSPFVFGQVFPEPTEDPCKGGYSILKPGAVFETLAKVPMITGEMADLTRYPARRGFEDIVILVSDAKAPLAWVAVTIPSERYVWFSLKNPRVLRSTLFWMSNAGRHYAPWSGRHKNIMGLEDITGCFHYGIAQSAGPNDLKKRGHVTSMELNPKQPLVVNYIQGIALAPKGFDRVKSIEPASNGRAITLRSENGGTITAPVDLAFLQ